MIKRLLLIAATVSMLSACGADAEPDDDSPRPGSAAALSQQLDDEYWRLIQEERLDRFGNQDDFLELADFICESLENGAGLMQIADEVVDTTPLFLNDAGTVIGLAGGSYCGDAARDAFPGN